MQRATVQPPGLVNGLGLRDLERVNRIRTVRALQREMSRQGFDTGPLDGRWGPRTSAAWQQYREQLKGVVDAHRHWYEKLSADAARAAVERRYSVAGELADERRRTESGSPGASSRTRGHGGAAQILAPGGTRGPASDYPGADWRSEGWKTQSRVGMAIAAAKWLKEGFETGLKEAQHPARAVKDISGVNPAHPLDEGLPWLGANVGMILLPGVGRGVRAGRAAAASILAREGLAEAARAARAGYRLPRVARKARLELEKNPFRNELHAQAPAELTTAQRRAYHAQIDRKLIQAARDQGIPASKLYTEEHAALAAGATRGVRASTETQRAVQAALRSGYDRAVFRTAEIKPSMMAHYIAEGEPGRFWYEDSAREILAMTGGDKELAGRFAQLVAIYSSQRAPIPNMQLASNAFHEFLHSGEVKSFGTAHQIREANAAMRGEVVDTAKRSNFFGNILEDIDPEKYAQIFPGGEVTNDLWMARLFGLKTDVPTPREYAAMKAAVQRIADRLGWKPKQVQAALWIAKKAEHEGTSIAEAAVNFADALKYETGIVPFEAAPGAEAARTLHEQYAKLPPEAKREYTAAKAELVSDFLREVGVVGRLGNEGVGVYEGQVNPGWSAYIAASRGKGHEHALRVAPEARKTLNATAAAIGQAFHQDAAAWFKPFYAEVRQSVPASAHNGIKVILGRNATEDEMRALNRAFSAEGHDIALVHEADGVYLLNFSELPNREFHQLAGTIVERELLGATDAKAFAFDGEYITRESYADHLGQPGAAGTRGSDLFGAAALRLEERGADVDFRFLRDPGAGREAGGLRHLEPGFGSGPQIGFEDDSEHGLVGDLAAKLFRSSGRAEAEATAASGGPETLKGFHGGPIQGSEVYLTPSKEYASAYGDVFEHEFTAQKVLRMHSIEDSIQVGRDAVEHFGGPEAAAARFNGDPQAMIAQYARDQGYDAIVKKGGAGLNFNIGPNGAEAVDEIVALDPQAIQSMREAAAKDKLMSGLSEGRAAGLRREQEALYSQERGRRAGLAEEELAKAPDTLDASLAAMKTQLKGSLSKLKFEGIRGLNEDEINTLAIIAKNHPDLNVFERLRVMDAVAHAYAFGRLPTKSELKLLRKVYGPDITAEAFAPTKLQKYAQAGFQLLNMPRALMASFDVSAPFRQGLVAFARHPVLTGRNMGPMLKYFASEHGYQDLMQSIERRPNFELYHDAKLAITDVEHSLQSREEQFMSSWAEAITGFGKKDEHGNYLFSGVRMSGRAYTGFLVKTRADMFDYLIEQAEMMGHDVSDREFLRDLGGYVNAATGRGGLGKFEGAAVGLNSFLFSPRLMASRLSFLNPLSYAKLHPFVRRQKLQAALQTAGTIGAILWLAEQVTGATVGLDPRSADFAKIRVGNTRIDIAGGFAQYVRLAGTLALAATGRTEGDDALQSSVRFLRGKFSPVAAIVADVLTHTNYAGFPLKKGWWKKEVYDSFIPLVVQDVRDLYHQTGSIPGAVAGFAAAATGIGVSSYGDPEKLKHPPKSYGDKQLEWQTKAKKTFGSLPPEVLEAERAKLLYHDALEHRKDELGVDKLTDRQRTHLKLTIVRVTHPEYADVVRGFQHDVDSADPEVVAAYDRWAKKAMGWHIDRKYHEYEKKLAAAGG